MFADTLGWRAIFWFLAIYSGVFLAILILFLPETLRSLVGNGSIPAQGLSQNPISYLRAQLQKGSNFCPAVRSTKTPEKQLNFLGPIRLIFSLEVSCAIFYLSIYYTGWQMTMSAMSTLFSRIYGLTSLSNGLTFIGNGAGCIIGTLSTGKVLDHSYRRLKKMYSGPPEDFPLEKARFQTLWIWSGLQCASVLVFGWMVDKGVHVSVPIIATFVLGWSTTSLQSIITTFMVDVFPDRSASAVASLNLARCLIGAGGTAAVLPLIDAIGAYTAITAVQVLASGLIAVQMRHGARWRRKREVKELESEEYMSSNLEY